MFTKRQIEKQVEKISSLATNLRCEIEELSEMLSANWVEDGTDEIILNEDTYDRYEIEGLANQASDIEQIFGYGCDFPQSAKEDNEPCTIDNFFEQMKEIMEWNPIPVD